MAKEMLEDYSRQMLEAKAAEIMKRPPSPSRDAAIQKLKVMVGKITEKYDLPVQALHPEAVLASVLDYIPGVARTVVGGGLTYAVGAQSGEKTASDIGNALIPKFGFGDPTPTAEDYRIRMGIPKGPGLSQIPGAEKLGITPGSAFDITPGGAADLLLNDPTLFMGGLKGLLAKGVKGAETKTAAQLAEEYANKVAASKDFRLNATFPQKLIEGAKNKVAWTAKTLKNPLQELSDSLYRVRMSGADAATELAGKKPFSQVMMENGRPGWTNAGIGQGAKDIVERNSNTIDQKLAKMEKSRPLTEGTLDTPMSNITAALDSPEIAGDVANPAKRMATKSAKEEALKPFRDTLENDPAIQEHLNTSSSMNTSEVPLWDEQGDLVKDIHPGQGPKFSPSVESSASEVPGVKVEYRFKDGSLAKGPNDLRSTGGYPNRAELPERVIKPQNRIVQNSHYTPGEASFPNEETPMLAQPNQPDIMDYQGGVTYTPQELGKMASGYGEKAQDLGWFNKRKITDARTVEGDKALAKVYNALRDKSRSEQLARADELVPGLGGSMHSINQDTSSIFTGAPEALSPQKFSVNPYSLLTNPLATVGKEVVGARDFATNAASKLLNYKPVQAGIKYQTNINDPRRSPWQSLLNQE